MNIEKKLEKLGITNVKRIDVTCVKKVARNIVNALELAFPSMYNEFDDVYIRLANCDMYYATVIKSISKVNYIYENNSIYIDEQVDLEEINEQIMHECIHYLQDKRTTQNKKLGLCSFSDFKVYGIGINEAGVQYISAKAVNKIPKVIERFGIRIKTITPNYYPLLTNLMEQIVYLLGEDIVVKAVLNGDSSFENVMINTFEEKSIKIIKAFDKILEYNNKMSIEANKNKIELFQNKIAKIYMETQNMIFATYFDKVYPIITTLEEIDKYETKAIYYRNVMGTELKKDRSKTDFFDTYMQELAQKVNKKMYSINKSKKNI